MDWTQIGIIAGVVLTASTAILNLGKIVSFASSTVGKLISLFRRSAPNNHEIPGRTVVVIQQPRLNALWWSEASFEGKPLIQVVGDFNLTNTWSKSIKLSGAVLRYKRWLFFSHEVRGDTSVKDIRTQYSGDYPVLPNEMTWLRVNFIFAPRSKLPTTDFIADVAVIDQFNNYHWLTNLCFKHPNTKPFDN